MRTEPKHRKLQPSDEEDVEQLLEDQLQDYFEEQAAGPGNTCEHCEDNGCDMCPEAEDDDS